VVRVKVQALPHGALGRGDLRYLPGNRTLVCQCGLAGGSTYTALLTLGGVWSKILPTISLITM
jgi:hypothetical protein